MKNKNGSNEVFTGAPKSRGKEGRTEAPSDRDPRVRRKDVATEKKAAAGNAGGKGGSGDRNQTAVSGKKKILPRVDRASTSRTKKKDSDPKKKAAAGGAGGQGGGGGKKKSGLSGQRRASPRKETGATAPRREQVFPPAATRSRSFQEDVSNVLVTGASGGVGSFLVKHLLREKYCVIVLDRHVEALPQPKGSRSLILRKGDLSDPASLAGCMEGVDAVIHASGQSGGGKSRADHLPGSMKETRAIFREARQRGVKRFVHIGSGLVYKKSSKPVAEQEDLDPRNEFEQDQFQAERAVLWEAGPGLPVVTVLRAGSIYGPGCKGLMASIATLPPLVKSLGPHYLRLTGGPTINLVHAEDVARAAVFLLMHPLAFHEVFNLGDRDPISFGECINIAMEAYGLTPLVSGVPYPPSTLLQSILPYVERDEIFSPLSRVGVLLWERMMRKQKLKKTLSPQIDRDALSQGSRDLLLNCQKLMGLGFRLKYPAFRKGWENTLSWYVNQAWVPRPDAL